MKVIQNNSGGVGIRFTREIWNRIAAAFTSVPVKSDNEKAQIPVIQDKVNNDGDKQIKSAGNTKRRINSAELRRVVMRAKRVHKSIPLAIIIAYQAKGKTVAEKREFVHLALKRAGYIDPAGVIEAVALRHGTIIDANESQ